ncbi:MAG: FecR domain-containing protein [Xanthobacteraceae bacterium]|nr:FecR domain-containing protein [Xanthobacteraceae bacterium]
MVGTMITGIALKRFGCDCGSMGRVVAEILQAVCLALLVGVTAAERAHAAADAAPERAETGAYAGTPPGVRGGGDSGGAVHASPGLLFVQSGAQPQAADAAPQSVGIVSSLQGSASVVRNGATAALKVQDEIFKGDILKTGQASTLGIIFDDETTFSLTANASVSVDDFVYAEGGDKNAANFKFVQGTVAFVANAVAKTGDMTLSTPTATMGIRGTTGLVNVGPTGATSGADAIKLYPDADGKVGRIEVKARDGTSLGVLTRPATGFSLQRGLGGGARVVATPLQISPQQAALDQNLVRQVHAERQRGQALVAQRRATRPHGPVPRNGIRGAPRPPAPAVRPPGPQKPPAVRRGPAPRPAFPPKGKPPREKRGR